MNMHLPISLHGDQDRCDVAIAGAGLAGAMLALRLAAVRPELSVQAYDRAGTVGAGRTWSFFATDAAGPLADWLATLIGHRWDSYEVRFPGFRRILHTGYRTLSPARMHAALDCLRSSAVLSAVERDGVAVEGEASRPAALVLDGRGGTRSRAIRLGFQKFYGQVVETEAPHGVERPILMDACVEQIDGYRFIYVLPFSPTRLLIEDTRYSDGPALDLEGCRAGIAAYAAAQRWRIASVCDEEQGVLPVVLTGSFRGWWADIRAAGAAVPIGTRAGFFHHTTSYSVPFAVAMADRIAAALPLTPDQAMSLVEQEAARLWRAQAFYRFLNRMLFLGCSPDRRWTVFRRFYALPEPLIGRFYAARSTWLDRLRICVGRPPISIFRALALIRAGRS